MQCQQLPSRYYNHGEAVFMRRTENGLSLPLSQNYSALEHFDSTGRLSRRNTPTTDTEKPGPAPRKRVPVACERCRKRKIKCSGDEGGSCVNCRNAGIADSCQFMRVASVDPNILRAMRGGSVWHGSHRYTPYPTGYKSHNATSQSTYPTYVSNSYSSQELSVGLEYTYPVASQHSPWSRSNSYAAQYSPYEEQPTASYSSQANPAFLLPNSDPMTASGTYPYPKTPLNLLLHESSAQLPSSQPISHLVTTSYPDTVYDQAVPYSALTNSAQAAFKGEQSNGYQNICMPQPPSATTDRTLPNPSRLFSSYQMSNIDSLPSTATVSHRSSLGWMTGSSSSSGSSASSGHNSCTSSGSQDFRYPMVGLATSPTTTLPPTSATLSTPELVRTQSPITPQLSQQQQCHTVTQQSLEGSSDDHQSHYTGRLVVRRSPSHAANTSAKATNRDIGENIDTYHRSHVDLSQHGSAGAEQFAADCSTCTTSASTQAPLAAIRNQLASY
ncbi:hypothetical protein DV738_g1959, partial [Chaetothyriales sp. CBS 135597]